jgi:MFS family permease
MRERIKELLPKDVRYLILSISLMSVLGGYMQVIRSIYLSLLGFSIVEIGLLSTVASLSGTIRTALYGLLADRFGRKPILVLTYLTSIPFYIVYFVSTEYYIFIIATIIAGTGAVGYGGVVHRAFLSEKSGEARRTTVFSIQYFVSSAFATIGTLISGIPEFLQIKYNLNVVDSIKPLFLLGIAFSLLATLLVSIVEESHVKTAKNKKENEKQEIKLKRSWRLIAKFIIAELLNSFGRGLIISLFSLWFYLRFNLDIKTIGYVFTVSRIVETFTYLAGPPLASKYGLVNTIVLSRFGGTLCTALIAFAPTPFLVAVLYAGRNAIQHISHPLQTSYQVAVFKPEERASAPGIIQLFTTITNSVAPTIGSYIMQDISLTLPLLISAAFFTAGNSFYYLFFRKIMPPEENIIKDTENSHMQT